MEQSELTKMKAAALRVANRVRKDIGLPPVKHLYKGRRRESGNCPITNTIYDDDLDRRMSRVVTGHRSVALDGTINGRWVGRRFELTPYAARFVHAFDVGDIPELNSAPSPGRDPR